ncbi:Yhk8p KNAG_0B04900 [Huiozyma naganishii CBS 8797]|uniref:Major facilitator superfamily (MFS) profile domain-containing protein n=1 Tax=Huiozyma naganishii (strain ATCC MYA-139 / BCRC 22969 / CBS 8797 / KCTC 17520 / NBRC 10181 / NCYC 3082 / Yp74L-3) TaxID=1071383 RepID=J7S3V3_HUIN7|nr:hypothetical protein KNAG_0B04900 [Kazachstania naganishii CBS 8797]CCK68924.1 hypothetical protein KNAG_0B04900 [Kazachstania naganishii CBS 8797]
MSSVLLSLRGKQSESEVCSSMESSDCSVQAEHSLGYGKETVNDGTAINYEVCFNGPDDEADPEDIARRLSMYRKYYIAVLITVTSMVITMISSCWTFVSPHIIEKFHVSREVSVLGIMLYVFGLAFGPLFLSPISELYGRRATFIFSLTLSIVWQCLTTWSRTLTGVMFGRFLSGFFGSSFLSVAGGAISDIFLKSQITVPMSLYTTAAMMGPSLGPIISGALYTVDFRWTFVTFIIASGVCLVAIVVTIPETYRPLLLINKARRFRKETGDDRYFAPLEVTRRETSFLSAALLSSRRPFMLLFRDPMMAVLCFYTGLELAIIYLYFVAFPYIYQTLYRFTVMQSACMYIGLMVGMILATPTSVLIQRRYEAKVAQNGGVSVPEMRFDPLFYGAILSPVGLMIFAWTLYSHVHWIGSMIGSALFGAGVLYVFIGIFNYTVDAYRRYAASGMACNSFVRCVMAGVFPLFGLQMYEGMGINWASFLIAMCTLAMVPVPFLFKRYGAYLRSRSPYAWDE